MTRWSRRLRERAGRRTQIPGPCLRRISRSHVGSPKVKVGLALIEPGQAAMRRCPPLDYALGVAGSGTGPKDREKGFEGGSGTLGDDLDPPIGEVGRTPGKAQFQRRGAGPPTEADALDAAPDPGGEALLGHPFSLEAARHPAGNRLGAQRRSRTGPAPPRS